MNWKCGRAVGVVDAVSVGETNRIQPTTAIHSHPVHGTYLWYVRIQFKLNFANNFLQLNTEKYFLMMNYLISAAVDAVGEWLEGELVRFNGAWWEPALDRSLLSMKGASIHYRPVGCILFPFPRVS